MTAGPSVILQARDVAKSYRAGTAAEVRALDGVSVEIPAGSFVSLTGPSGSGKTTLLAILGGLERPTQGAVLFDGRDLAVCSDAELARVRRRMGFVFQDFALIPTLSIRENVAYPLIPRGVGRRDRKRRADEWLARFGLDRRAGAKPPELSGGEQQRAALARALVGRPEVVLADEPTSNLDPAAAAVALDVLRELVRGGGTVVAASHDPTMLASATQTIALDFRGES